jgi:ferredoxin
MIKILVENIDGTKTPLEIPEDHGLSLMEVLKAAEYPILATCGGIAICATCRVQVREGNERLPSKNAQELDMLDLLPDSDAYSRLACQLRVNQNMDGMIFFIKGD